MRVWRLQYNNPHVVDLIKTTIYSYIISLFLNEVYMYMYIVLKL